MSDNAEDRRLLGIYGQLREKLLDLSKRNRMLNYEIGAKNKRQVRFVGADLQGLYDVFISPRARVAVVPLPEPDSIPSDERTPEFLVALNHTRDNDVEYLIGLEGLSSTAADSDQALDALDRTLRDKVRVQLNLPPRGARKTIQRNDHARSLGLEPSLEPKQLKERPDPVVALQTLRFPDELDAQMAKLYDDARLAQQESGVSTLFLALGILEWYESDTSETRYSAPLLLLPVQILREMNRGRATHALVATEPLESNVSLARFLEVEHGRSLPTFVQREGEEPASIDAYIERVTSSLEGLKRWTVRRFTTLDNFAFSRIAIYEDVAPERWGAVPLLENPLIRTMLTGYETRDFDGGSGDFREAPDYRIDDPDIERVAPILIHDADASQHSALVDVMKGTNLVIQGPPGTGKSQTIVNVIANALNAGKTVLFVSEKQAALEAVKRRLDSAGLGVFCLEVHSEKAASKAVVGALRERHDLGAARRAPVPPTSDAAWFAARTEIARYLDALHTTADDGKTPFDLMWHSIRARATHADILAELGPAELPPSLFADAAALAAARDDLDIYAVQAQQFADMFGHVAQSPWNRTPPIDFAAYDKEPLLAAIAACKRAIVDLTVMHDRLALEGIGLDALSMLDRADQILGAPPSSDAIATIGGLDLDDLDGALALKVTALDAARSLSALPDPGVQVVAALPAAMLMIDQLNGLGTIDHTPGAIFERVGRMEIRYRAYLDSVATLQPALTALAVSDDAPAPAISTVAEAIVALSEIDPVHRKWLDVDLDELVFHTCRERWDALRAEDAAVAGGARLQVMRTALADLEAAAAVLKRTGPARLLSLANGEAKAARALAARIGPAEGPQALATILRLAEHLRAVERFEANPEVAAAMGTRWVGLATPLDEIDVGLQWRRYLLAEIGGRPHGMAIAEAAIGLPPRSVAALVDYRKQAEAYLAAASDFDDIVAAETIAGAARHCLEGIETGAAMLALNQGGALSSTPLTLRELREAVTARAHLSRLEASVAASPLVHALRTVARDNAAIEVTRRAIAWRRSLGSLDLPRAFSNGLMEDPAAWRAKLREIVAAWSAADEVDGRARKALGAFRLEGLEGKEGAELVAHLDALLARGDELSEFAALRRARTRLEESGLRSFLDRADEALVPALQLPDVFDAVLSRRRADDALRASSALAQATSATLDGRRRFFADRDRLRIQADRITLRNLLLASRPPPGSQFGPKRDWTEMCLLQSEFAKEDARFVKVRDLLRRAGGAVRCLTPCFMMSPLSLAKFLTPDQAPFDLLVIDEASQMRPEDALGAMLRARQMVVVGDPKQLPPTDFFQRGAQPTDDDDDVDEVDDESILERCEKAFRQVRRLRWHYRSRCESLIRFSNENFYGNGLVTFPAATPGSFSVDLVRVEGTYQANRNAAEADRIAEEAVGMMRHFADAPEDSIPTLLIVAVNGAQTALIQEILRRLCVGDELVAAYMEKAERRGEPVVVKNLENVQGDERDYVFISLTYGRAPGATAVMQRFGPINKLQGHRRLNVLFSRARRRVALFTSMSSSDVVPVEKSREGVHVLRRYLEYAEGGGRAKVERIGGKAESDFELEVADRLVRRGYSIDYQVGVSGFRIDLGVRHPDHPEMFLAGIECDGASYHSSKSARDRDRLREEVLRGLGWDLLRVWSTDWFANADLQTDRLAKRLEEMRAKPVHADRVYSVGTVFAGATGTPGEGGDPMEPGVPATSSYGSDIPAAAAGSSNDDEGPLDESAAVAALVAYRETVIRPATIDWAPHRSILRDGLIETLIKQRLSDPEDWFRLVPVFQRSGTDPRERHHLDRICAIVGRMVDGDRGKGEDRPAPVKSPAPTPRPADVAPDANAYVRADHAGIAIDRDAFYEVAYRATLRRLVERIVEIEAPIYSNVLAMRVARAHGMERTGTTIRKVVADAAARFPSTKEEGREVVWRPGSPTDGPVPFRNAAEHVRAHGDVPIAELASLALPHLRRALSDDQIVRKMAEALKLGRTGAPARRRLVAALAVARRSNASGPSLPHVQSGTPAIYEGTGL